MNTNRTDCREWSDLELEAFHDGELAPAASAELSRSLMRSPALRARLAAIVRADAAVLRLSRSAPRGAEKIAARPTGAQRWSRRVMLAIAATVMLAACGAVYFAANREVLVAPAESRRTAELGPRDRSPQPAARIVLSIDIPASVPVRPVAASPLRSASVERSVSAKTSSAGPAPLSTADLRRRLDAIKEPRERLAVCVAWARERRQTPALFDQIERIATEPSMFPSVVGALNDLAQLPDLRAYVRQSEARIAAAKAPRG